MASQAEPTAFCSECRIHYPNYMAYAAHRTRKMKTGEGHIHCKICGMDFYRRETLNRHQKQEHAHEQDLDCLGCGLHFTRVGSLIHHFENEDCVSISRGKIERARWDRSRMSRGLPKWDGEDPKSYFGKFLFPGTNFADRTPLSIDPHPGLLDHIESMHPGSSSLDSSSKATEGSSLSAGAQSSQSRPICGLEPHPLSFHETNFPAPADANLKEQIGSLSQICARPGPPDKGKAQDTSILASSTVQHAPGSDIRLASLNETEFPTLTEAITHKGNMQRKHHIAATPGTPISGLKAGEASKLGGVKTLRDSRWAPKNMTAVPAHQNQRSGTMEASTAPLEPLQNTGSLHQASLQIPSEEAKAAPEEHHPKLFQAFDSDTHRTPARGVKQSENTSHSGGLDKGAQTPGSQLKDVPPHLRGKLLPVESMACSQVSSFSADDPPIQKRRPHLQGQLGAGPTTQCTWALKDENNESTANRSTIKHSDQGTMGIPPLNVRDSRTSSALPPHLRGKVKGSLRNPDQSVPVSTGTSPTASPPTDNGSGRESPSSNGGVPLGHRRGLGHGNSALAKPVKSQFSGAPRISPGQRIVGSEVELSRTQPSRSLELVGTVTRGNTSLPPHLTKGTSGNGAPASLTNPIERDCSPTPNMSNGKSTPDPIDSGSEMGAGPIHHPRNNFGAAQYSKSYATIVKGSEKLPPHLRVKPGTSPMRLTPPRSVDTQTTVVSEIHQSLTLRTINTNLDEVSVMGPEEEGTRLGPHDPKHDLFNARGYLSPYTNRFQCPITKCGKGFKSMQGITSHLASEVHRRPAANFQCPHCLRHFASPTALTQHSESQGRRCEIRNTDEFRPYLEQLTAGIADVNGVHIDQTNRYVITEEAVETYGDTEALSQRVLAQQEIKETEDKTGHYYDGKPLVW